MNSIFHRLLKKVMGVSALLLLLGGIALTTFSVPAKANQSELSGNFSEDTVEVAETLQGTIALPFDSETHTTTDSQTLLLINDYMSRYRPNTRVNDSLSFTTMQTALGSLAAHYKNAPNRPIPEKLKERLNQELSKAEKQLIKES